jgi:hypothetical protein
MLPPSGVSRAERWVAQGRRAAACDLIQLLHSLGTVNQVHLLTGDPEAQDEFGGIDHLSISHSDPDFNFADSLLRFAQDQDPEILLYFGAGSAPLLRRNTVEMLLDRVSESSDPFAIVNNIHSTDWAIFNDPMKINTIAHRLPTDNQLGWVLQNETSFEVDDLPFSSEARMDIDTPTDLIMLALHPDLGPITSDYLEANKVGADDRLAGIIDLLRGSARTLAIIGRSSSDALRVLEKNTQIWVRTFVEERGMVASGRLARGEVRSLLAEVVHKWGIEPLIDFMSSISDGVLWDTRVMMAHNKSWPTDADRFASDLGWIEEISDPKLREFTEHVVNAPIPITTGGHSVVSGGVTVLLDSIRSE